MGVYKGKVIIWRSFPSPSEKKHTEATLLKEPARLTVDKPKLQSEIDEEALAHWSELADLVLHGESDVARGARARRKKKKLTA